MIELAICPACITTAALIAASASSTGGVTAFVAKKFYAKIAAKNQTTQTRGKQNEIGTNKTSKNRTGS